jgi:hypothetical protein
MCWRFFSTERRLWVPPGPAYYCRYCRPRSRRNTGTVHETASYSALDQVPAQSRLSMSEVACNGCLGSCARCPRAHIAESTHGLGPQGVIAYLDSSVLACANLR